MKEEKNWLKHYSQRHFYQICNVNLQIYANLHFSRTLSCLKVAKINSKTTHLMSHSIKTSEAVLEFNGMSIKIDFRAQKSSKLNSFLGSTQSHYRKQLKNIRFCCLRLGISETLVKALELKFQDFGFTKPKQQ